ncbi:MULTISPECIES: hypothetical protein [unclassified Mycolicibacterium]|uniref:hypothetical protein n=1 Tax=unclassified Mycolicibacterium TaxID=2636767 RepID=UPI002EDB8CD5
MKLTPSHDATVQHRQDALNTYRMVSEELPAVRAMADSWRKGIAGLLVAVVGFTVIRGRSDLSQLATGWAIAVGGLLAGVVIVGGFAAYQILGAAHGWPRPVPAISGRRTDGTVAAAPTTHDLTMKSLAALRQGMGAAVVSVVLLMAAIGVTWFGPAKEPARLAVTDGSGASICGKVKQTDHGRITLDTAAGTTVIDLGKATNLMPVETCPGSDKPK